jgi:hypothetical protein
MHEEGDIDKRNVSGEQKENFDRCPATGPDEGDLLRQRQQKIKHLFNAQSI